MFNLVFQFLCTKRETFNINIKSNMIVSHHEVTEVTGNLLVRNEVSD
jgi:hypothetical protein